MHVFCHAIKSSAAAHQQGHRPKGQSFMSWRFIALADASIVAACRLIVINTTLIVERLKTRKFIAPRFCKAFSQIFLRAGENMNAMGLTVIKSIKMLRLIRK